MTVYLSHISALEYWARSKTGSAALAAQRQGACNPSWRSCASLPDGCRATASELQRLIDQVDAPLSIPLHTLVSRPELRTRWRGAACHAISKPLPRGSFVKAGKGIYVSSPELCLVQMAPRLPPAALAKLGCELCGTYGIPTVGHTDYGLAHPYLTREALERFLERAGSLPGAAQARRALAHIAFGAASPMETALVLLLCLPLRMGGYHLPKPQMNLRVDPRRRSRFVSDGTCYYCDLIWPEAAVALEYDSFEFHGTRRAQADDAKRRAELLGRGITAISVTGRTVRNLLELDMVARTLARKLRVRLRNNSDSWRAAQHELHGSLLAPEGESCREPF